MPAHLVDAARLESYRERTVVVGLGRLVRVEREVRGIPDGDGGEAEDHFGGLLLEGAERTLRVPFKVEIRVPLEGLVADVKLAHVGEAPEPRLLAPVARRDEERTVSMEEPQGPDTLPAFLSRRLGEVGAGTSPALVESSRDALAQVVSRFSRTRSRRTRPREPSGHVLTRRRGARPDRGSGPSALRSGEALRLYRGLRAVDSASRSAQNYLDGEDCKRRRRQRAWGRSFAPENPILSPRERSRGGRAGILEVRGNASTDRPRLINEYPLQWVGVYRGKVSAKADDLPSLMEELDQARHSARRHDRSLHREEPAHADPLACCGEDSATPPVGLTWRDTFCSPGWDGVAKSRSFSTPERTRPC